MVLFATEMINKQYMKIKGEEAATSNGHMIIVGWNERAKHVVKQMHVLQPNLDIVLIDETLSLLPKPFHHLEFIKRLSASRSNFIKGQYCNGTHHINNS